MLFRTRFRPSVLVRPGPQISERFFTQGAEVLEVNMGSPIDRTDVDLEPERAVADPARHAEALIDTLGVATALEMVDLYARRWPASLYWARVLAALRDRPLSSTTFEDPSAARQMAATAVVRNLTSSWAHPTPARPTTSNRGKPPQGRGR